MPQPCFLICERTGRWALAWKRCLAAGVRIRQLRHLDEVRTTLAGEPGSLVALEMVPGNVERVLDQLSQWRRGQPSPGVLVVAQRGLEPYQWLCRELGALAFTCSPRQVPRLSPMVHRYLDRPPSEEADRFQQIRDRLPWSAARPDK